MDPSTNTNDDMQLPPVQPGAGSTAPQGDVAQPSPAPESEVAAPAPSAEPPMTVPAQPAAAPAPTSSPATASVNGDDQTPAIADDADLIEKEWVEKAKQLVEQTKNDPHKQNEVINKFKADYIKKRYNKDIKL